MSIQFTPDDWSRTKKNYSSWWKHELERPLIPVRLEGKEPTRPKPSAPLLTRENCTDLSGLPGN